MQNTVQQAAASQMAPSTANSATINLKWNHRGTYHRFEIPREAGCSTLMKRITVIFPNFYGQIGWKDEDGDTVIISSDEELLHAASLPQNQQLLRLFTIENTDNESEPVVKIKSEITQSTCQKTETNSLPPSNYHHDHLSADVRSGSRRFLLMAQEQLLNTQKLFHKSIRSSSSGSQLSIKSAINNTNKIQCDKQAKSSAKGVKANATKVTGTQPNLKAMFSVAKRKITGNKAKKLSQPYSNGSHCANDVNKTETTGISVKILEKNEREYSNKSMSSDSDIEIIEKTDDSGASEHDDWTLINCSTNLYNTHLN